MRDLLTSVESLVAEVGERGAKERLERAFENLEATTSQDASGAVATLDSAGTVKALKELKALSAYSLEDLEKVLSGIDPAQGAAMKVLRSVLVASSPRWREAQVKNLVKLPELTSVSWHVVDQTTVEPKVAFDLRVDGDDEGEDRIAFKASRPMLTVLTDSMRRIQRDLESVSGQ